ncbi:SDR family NAD(P)-dependent oxidoreductase [Anaerotruncus colihominis]|nr:SDR family oxidoreductase [Anaerotruncus colihominis]MCR2027104.1 SDR family oxidoreductase [Anaerotruncus colihominis]
MMTTPIKSILDFEGKTAVITGGCAGMGTGLAKRFAQTGANIAVTYFRTPPDELIAQLEADGARCMAVRTDVRSPADSEAMIRAVAERFGSVDFLINNAGIYPHHDLLKVTEQEWDDMHDSNLKGAFFCARAAAQQMIAQGRGGRIVNIVSINAFRPMRSGLVYGASKAGLAMATRCMAVELGKYDIRVNAVAPGLMDAPGLDENVPGWRARYSGRAPLGRIGRPEDIADACIFYCSDLSAWITGEITMADGGVMHAEAYDTQ